MDTGGNRTERSPGILLPALAVTASLVLPLAGALVDGQPAARFLEFPPLTRYVRHAPFSPLLYSGGLVLFAALLLPYVLLPGRGPVVVRSGRAPGSMPWWGRAGLVLCLATWICAWNRFAWFRPLQAYTFTPLWLGYILIVAGWTRARGGVALHRVGNYAVSVPQSCERIRGGIWPAGGQGWRFLLLFPVSSLFWWYFEYLNRFVQNWYYLGIDDFSAAAYVIHASLCFSTVLPAVAVTIGLLDTVPRLHDPLCRGPALVVHPPRAAGLALLVLALAGLAGIAVYPDLLFPLVWVAPFLVLVALQVVAGRPTVFAGLAKGDWRPVLLPPLAALICGLFWEMWNWQSLARWHYSIPYVDGPRLFAMPLPGYMGYLPFGLECYAIIRLLGQDPLTTCRLRS
ncbi:hypothetical protein ACLG6S_01530 [Thermodesulfobacteriota bacterium B35]